MPSQKIKRHLDGEKSMPLLRLPRGPQGLFAAPVKSNRQRRKHRLALVVRDPSVAFEIQADLDAAGMKTPAPVKFHIRFEVMPLKARAPVRQTAVQMPPAI